MQQYLPAEIVAKLDFQTLKIEKDSFIEKELQPHFSDMLYTVNYRQQPLHAYLLFEHKSYTDSLIAFQLLSYMLKIWGQYRKQHPKTLVLPVILPLVLYHGQPQWQIVQDFQALFAPLDAALKPFVPDFRYHLYDISHWADEQIQGELMTRLVLLAMKYILKGDPKQHLPQILQLMQEMVQHESGLHTLEMILRYFVQVNQKLDENDVKQLLQTSFKGVDLMPTFIDYYIEKGEKQGFQRGIEQGIEQGIERGIEQGIERGIERGIEEGRKGQVQQLLRQIQLKFGDISPSHKNALQNANSQTLLVWSERILTANSLEQLLGLEH